LWLTRLDGEALILNFKGFADYIDDLCKLNLLRLVISQPQENSKYMKIDIRLHEFGYQAEMLTQTQAFHKNLAADEISLFLAEMVPVMFHQLNAWTRTQEYQLRITSKGKVLTTSREADVPMSGPAQHDRQKQVLINPGDFVPPLVDMGIMTADGQVIHAMQGKFRQINRFLEIVDDEIRQLAPTEPLRILDFGCGKSYLTFILYYYFVKIRKIPIEMTGLDLKEDVIAKCSLTARKYGYDHLSFQAGDIGSYNSPEPLDMVITLHACDTATDDALFHAVMGNARMIFTAPCCQHELNKQMKSDDLALITRYGVVKERTAALMTDAIRANLLACCGYRTQLMEFVDMAHTPKNLLIRAVKTGSADRGKMLAEVESLMRFFHLSPAFYRLLKEAGKITASEDDQSTK
jgi:SAM-dependent methyltransferase